MPKNTNEAIEAMAQGSYLSLEMPEVIEGEGMVGHEGIDLALSGVAEALRDNNVNYALYSSVALRKQLERLYQHEDVLHDMPELLRGRIEDVLRTKTEDIDLVVSDLETLRRLRRALLQLPNFSLSTMPGNPVDGDGFGIIHNEPEVRLFSGELTIDNGQGTLVISVECYSETLINPKETQSTAEVIDKHGLRVLSLRGLRTQYANNWRLEGRADAMAKEMHEQLEVFGDEQKQLSAVTGGGTSDLDIFMKNFCFDTPEEAHEYLNEFDHLNTSLHAAEKEGNAKKFETARHAMHVFFGVLKTKTEKRAAKALLLDDILYFLDTGSDPALR